MNLTPVTLQGNYVRLVPLSLDHLDDLCLIGLEHSVWKWTIANVTNREEMLAYLKVALAEQERGTGLPFTTMTNVGSPDGSFRVAGSTRYFNIATQHKRLEIGNTWIASPWQRTVVNTEAKYLMLQYAFEKLGCNRVEFKTDALNTKSRTAILRLGAKEEGILRNHSITALGRVRDTVYFSILNEEWPEVKKRLEEWIEKARAN